MSQSVFRNRFFAVYLASFFLAWMVAAGVSTALSLNTSWTVLVAIAMAGVLEEVRDWLIHNHTVDTEGSE